MELKYSKATESLVGAVRQYLSTSASVADATAGEAATIAGLVERIVDCYRTGGKVVLFGNGGSAAEAEHVAAELLGRFRLERPALPALALNVNTSVLTAISNDYSYEVSFKRQVEGLVRSGDVVIAISTSGRSRNVLEAIQEAKRRGAYTVALTGAGGSDLMAAADAAVVIPSTVTSHIQEAHVAVGHIVCQLVEQSLFGEPAAGC